MEQDLTTGSVFKRGWNKRYYTRKPKLNYRLYRMHAVN